jgi:hypothetical protein
MFSYLLFELNSLFSSLQLLFSRKYQLQAYRAELRGAFLTAVNCSS